MSADFSLTANVVDVHTRSIRPAVIRVEAGRIAAIVPTGATAPDAALPYALPGFVDAHVHVES